MVQGESRPTTLAGLLKEEPTNPEEVLPVFVRVADRLSVIHKDPTLKPVLDPQRVSVAGGAVEIDTVPVGPNHATQALSGKYASFEELTEPSENLHRSTADVYVLGLVFYEILLGRRLFNLQFADLLHADSEFRWLNWHCDPAKTAVPLERLVPDFPQRLSEIVAAMMQKDVAQRPALAAVASAFQQFLKKLDQDRMAGTPTVRIRRKRSWAPVKRFVKGTVAASIVVVISVAGFRVGWQFWRDYRANPLADDKASQSGTTAPAESATVATAPPTSPAADTLPTEIDSGTGIIVLIPGTAFEMGSDAGQFNGDEGYENETPPHQVSIPAFYIDKYEVTNRFYKEFAIATGRKFPANPTWDDHYFDKPDYPVMNVSWIDAKAYATWAGKQLPTEAQWELAARGAEGNRYPWGNQFVESAANLTGSGDGARFTAPVGNFKDDMSAFGVMDMAGNVSEWVGDLYSLYPGNAGPLDVVERSYRVVRGAGMTFSREYARLTRRMSHNPELSPGQHTAIGFRCVSEVETIQRVLMRTRKE